MTVGARTETRGDAWAPNTAFVLLDAGDPEQRAEWVRRWDAWPRREVFGHPDYVRLFARPCDRALCAAGAGALFPLILRPLAAEPWAAPGESRWDATTPYGYGGAQAVGGRAPAAAEELWRELEEALSERRVVASFARLSLFEREVLAHPGEVTKDRDNVVRALGPTPDELWLDYAPKVRRNVARARQRGLEVTFDETGARLDDFLAVYLETMNRRRAAAGYYFPRTFFEAIVARLGGQFVFAHALRRGGVAASALVLLSSRRAYYFLGGTRAAAMADRPSDLLHHEVACWARAAGMEDYVLGGGATPAPEDGVLRFKRGFAPGGLVPFRVARATYEAEAVAELVARRRAWEAARGVAWRPSEGFFPPYRG